MPLPSQYKPPTTSTPANTLRNPRLDMGTGLDANQQYLYDMIMGSSEYADYSDNQKNDIFEWLSGQQGLGPEMPMPDFLASAATLPGRELPNPSPLSTNPKPVATAPATKPVGPKDVMANANAPDYMAQRYAGKTQDQMNTMFLDDAIKRRMGYSSGPMDEQLASWARANGRDESKFNEALNRHHAGVQSNNPYAQVPKDQLNGRDQGMANAQRLLSAGLITSDQMPMVANPTWSGDNAKRLAGTEYQGFSDSRQRQMMEGVDAAYGAVQGAKKIGGSIADSVRGLFGSGQGQQPQLAENEYTLEQAKAGLETAKDMTLPMRRMNLNLPDMRSPWDPPFVQPSRQNLGIAADKFNSQLPYPLRTR